MLYERPVVVPIDRRQQDLIYPDLKFLVPEAAGLLLLPIEPGKQ